MTCMWSAMTLSDVMFVFVTSCHFSVCWLFYDVSLSAFLGLTLSSPCRALELPSVCVYVSFSAFLGLTLSTPCRALVLPSVSLYVSFSALLVCFCLRLFVRVTTSLVLISCRIEVRLNRKCLSIWKWIVLERRVLERKWLSILLTSSSRGTPMNVFWWANVGACLKEWLGWRRTKLRWWTVLCLRCRVDGRNDYGCHWVDYFSSY